ncbi:hypothetical protein GL218_01652 [Daldinia childiae]|uniref:uncharacterized protein n=1 Tax=Daldinia childiae TaxID=326645 RepID=UPI001445133C|nr:uncharacterized protein GL218_01652 [Daldinia childiae]KAF3064700.1 hypothetical protein GL218_01652 [Daldinia childiae]
MEASELPELHGEPTQCEKVGEAMPDIAGYGVLIGFSVQAFISLVLSIWAFFLTKFGRLEVQGEEGTAQHANEKKRLGFVTEILMVGNDLQMITGLALIGTALAHGREIDLYHLHLVYDTVSFVGVSNAAALVCWTFMRAKSLKSRSHHKIFPAYWTGRFRVSYAFAVLFLGLTIFLEVRLDEWSLTAEEAGHCYITTGLAVPGADHPTTDKAYVAITAVWLLLVMFGSLFASVKFRKPLLLLSALQFPVHLYMMIKLRMENYPYLEGEDENRWDFGQTTAIILLAVTVVQLIHQGIEYIKFERALKKYGPSYALAQKEEFSEVPSLVEQGLRQIQEAKQNASSVRLERSSETSRHDESHELMENPEHRA